VIRERRWRDRAMRASVAAAVKSDTGCGMTPQQPHASGERREGDGGGCPVPRRSFLRACSVGAAAAPRELVPTGAAHAQGTAYETATNKLATEDGTHSFPFYGQHQAGIATPAQTGAAFLSFDVTQAAVGS